MAWFGCCGSKIQNSEGHRPSLSNVEEESKNVTQHGLYDPFPSLTGLHSWRIMKFMYTVHSKTQIPEGKRQVPFFLFLNFSSLMAQTWSLRTRPKRWKTPQLWNLGPLWRYTPLQTCFIVVQDGVAARGPDSTLLSFLSQRSDFFKPVSVQRVPLHCLLQSCICISITGKLRTQSHIDSPSRTTGQGPGQLEEVSWIMKEGILV